MKELMCQPGMQEKINSKFGHYYLDALKEEIVKELNLDSPTMIYDLTYDQIQPEIFDHYDPEAQHNLSEVNNHEAVGYNNIDERAQNPERNRELANQTLFDELLGEYFR